MFLVLSGRRSLQIFKSNPEFLGGIYISKADEDFSFSIHSIPSSINRIYVENNSVYFQFLLTHVHEALLKQLEIIAFNADNDIIQTFNLDLQPLRFHYPKDNLTLDPVELKIVLRCCENIKLYIQERTNLILESDPRQPSANWEEHFGHVAIGKTIAEGNLQIINHLRMFAQQFSGYSLWQMKDASGVPFVTEDQLNCADKHFEQFDLQCDTWTTLYINLLKSLPQSLHLAFPNRFGEVGWLYDGKIVNHDTFIYLQRMAILYENGVFDRLASVERPVILEIGGGFGGLAYMIKQFIPNAIYLIVDLPESLVYSSIYLSTLFKDENNHFFGIDDCLFDQEKFIFIPNTLFPQLLESQLQVDLCINTLSMSEMSELQVREYCAGIQKLLGKSGVFFEQNQNNIHLGLLNAEDIISEYFKSDEKFRKEIVEISGKANFWINK